jgi:hypothetical protein
MLDPKLADDVRARSPLATAWRHFDPELERYITMGLAAA